jgi:hypothetical protein
MCPTLEHFDVVRLEFDLTLSVTTRPQTSKELVGRISAPMCRTSILGIGAHVCAKDAEACRRAEMLEDFCLSWCLSAARGVPLGDEVAGDGVPEAWRLQAGDAVLEG